MWSTSTWLLLLLLLVMVVLLLVRVVLLPTLVLWCWGRLTAVPIHVVAAPLLSVTQHSEGFLYFLEGLFSLTHIV